MVIGGSQGAVGLNRMVRAVLPELLEQGCRVVHLTGRNDPEVGQMQHPLLAERPFSDEIPGLLQHADLAVSRAGAGSLSELAVCGTPTILVPLPPGCGSTPRGQCRLRRRSWRGGDRPSARTTGHGAGTTIQRLLGHRLGQVQADPSLLPTMRRGMENLAMPDADQRLVDLLQSLVA